MAGAVYPTAWDSKNAIAVYVLQQHEPCSDGRVMVTVIPIKPYYRMPRRRRYNVWADWLREEHTLGDL